MSPGSRSSKLTADTAAHTSQSSNAVDGSPTIIREQRITSFLGHAGSSETKKERADTSLREAEEREQGQRERQGGIYCLIHSIHYEISHLSLINEPSLLHYLYDTKTKPYSSKGMCRHHYLYRFISKVGVLLVRCDQFTYQQFRIPVLQRALLVAKAGAGGLLFYLGASEGDY